MSNNKFTTYGPDGFLPLRKNNHQYPYPIILPGLVDSSNNFNHPVTHHWPPELTYVLRPMCREYIINNNLSWI